MFETFEIHERLPRYPNEPRRKRLSFVRPYRNARGNIWIRRDPRIFDEREIWYQIELMRRLNGHLPNQPYYGQLNNIPMGPDDYVEPGFNGGIEPYDLYYPHRPYNRYDDPRRGGVQRLDPHYGPDRYSIDNGDNRRARMIEPPSRHDSRSKIPQQLQFNGDDPIRVEYGNHRYHDPDSNDSDDHAVYTPKRRASGSRNRRSRSRSNMREGRRTTSAFLPSDDSFDDLEDHRR